jgi:hypothetical protein
MNVWVAATASNFMLEWQLRAARCGCRGERSCGRRNRRIGDGFAWVFALVSARFVAHSRNADPCAVNNKWLRSFIMLIP